MIKKIVIILAFTLMNPFSKNLLADSIYYLDLKYVLNQSVAGKKAQDLLKKKLDKGIKELKTKETNLQNNEKKLIQQKKLISPEEYKTKVSELRKKVSSLQKERNILLENISKQRSKARNKLLETLNPILKDYMKEKNIRIVVDKKSLLLGDENLDLTNEITNILNKKLTSIKLD